MRIVIAPDKFKGCLSARQVAAAMAAGVREAAGTVEVEEIPMADGGEGTVEALVAATGGRTLFRQVTGPLPEMKVDATFGILGDGKTAVIEMAAASGFHLLRPKQRNPMNTTTYGTGELLMAACAEGAEQIILGIGGSATVDGGIGCAQACGVDFEMSDGAVRGRAGRPLTGQDVQHVRRVLPSVGSLIAPLVDRGAIRVACDVDNPLFGPNGAARVFGPQKGATPEQVEALDRALAALAALHRGQEMAQRPGAGAAGGLGFGMMAFLGAQLRPGFGMVADAVGLRQRLAGADLVLTGEGRLDASSMRGKTAVGVARLCKELGLPCVALVGSVGEGAQRARAEGMTAWFSIGHRPMTLEEAMQNAPALIEPTAANVMRAFCAGRHSGQA